MNNEERNGVVRQLIVQTLLWLAINGAQPFAAAGTVRWPEAWVYLGLWLAGAVVSGSLLVQKNPDILKERMRSPMQSQRKRWDRPLMAIFGGWAALQIVAGLDVVRYGWSRMPLWLEVASALAVVIGIYVFHIVMLENSYASPVVKVDAERGHCVVSSGPYAWVRHPLLSRDGAVAWLLVRVCHRHRADRDHRVARRLGRRNAESRVTWVRRLRQRREVSARAGLVVVSRPMSASLDIAPR